MNAFATSSPTRVLDHPGLWNHPVERQGRVRALSTGWPSLDTKLPGGGWPQGALSEILFEHGGLGELDLVMPALASLTQDHRRVIFVAPPDISYSAALAAAGVDTRFLHEIHAGSTEAAWTMEQCLRSGCCGAVIGWLPDADYRSLRRVQLAAESGDACAIVFRPAAHAPFNSPASLRIKVSNSDEATYVDVLKSRELPTTTAPLLRMRA
ncbi:MAG: Cell division inhibitor SulA [Luteibacter sp.]|uniref:translesion DNA synthesis-associated protein ImuA n=1 Tax=Luteibacter sp. TaxID=1886636 RepID=UPI0013847A41|nr:translesion DNA synthesis-associated protein ImuA [Luteibacter sp.]KAF1005786.1 MAG: Cell division inhibitor SulA [Luteibacter sp.]